MFSMKDTERELEKIDCRELKFGGWRSTRIVARRQAQGWSRGGWLRFSLDDSHGVPLTGQVPIDYEKPYSPPRKVRSAMGAGGPTERKKDSNFADFILRSRPVSPVFHTQPKRTNAMIASKESGIPEKVPEDNELESNFSNRQWIGEVAVIPKAGIKVNLRRGEQSFPFRVSLKCLEDIGELRKKRRKSKERGISWSQEFMTVSRIGPKT
jgi:hypothetical protein